MFVRQVPRDSALARVQLGDAVEWDLANHLRAAAVDEARVGNWQRANAGAKKPTEPPDPIQRPGVTPHRKSRGDAMPIAELRAEIERRRKAPAVRKG